MRGELISGTASGKTTFAEELLRHLGVRVTQFSFDNFYRGIPAGVPPEKYDFDHPDALDFDLLLRCLLVLLRGEPVDIPQYCFKSHCRLADTTRIYPAPIIILEGILVFQDKRIRELFDLKIFIQCDSDVALARRLVRDIKERQRDLFEVLRRYHTFVKPDYNRFVLPMMKVVDFTVRSDVPDSKATNIIFEYLWNKLSGSRKNSLSAADCGAALAAEGGAPPVQVRDYFSAHLGAALFDAPAAHEGKALEAAAKNFMRVCWEQHAGVLSGASPHFLALCDAETVRCIGEDAEHDVVLALFLDPQAPVPPPVACRLYFSLHLPCAADEFKRRRSPRLLHEQGVTALLKKFFDKYAQRSAQPSS